MPSSYPVRVVQSIPSARRLVTSLRDLGYDFSAAVADIVDNSISAGATRVGIDITFSGDDSWVRIADNGSGMSEQTLYDAMRYGAHREYDETDLGRFGLGLKTASMSQCQRLTVASRAALQQTEPVVCCWDLEHIEQSDAWELLTLTPGEISSAVVEPLENTTGTVVFWERLDRILGYKHPYGEAARKMLLRLCRELEEHLAMVFHRFLAGELEARRLAISINGNVIEAWDPFVRNEQYVQTFPEHHIPLEYDGYRDFVIVTPYVLPHQSRFSSPQAATRAAGPNRWNRQQGFYIYRAGRMIQSGGWSRLRTLDEHTKLIRIALSFPTGLDAAFKINVAKMRVQLPVEIRDNLQTVIAPALRAAQTEYRNEGARRQSKLAARPAQPVQPQTSPLRSPTPGANETGYLTPTSGASSQTIKPSQLRESPANSLSEDSATESGDGQQQSFRSELSEESLEKAFQLFLLLATEDEKLVLTDVYLRLKQHLNGFGNNLYTETQQ